MRWPRRDTLIPLALGALAFAVALLQRPGLIVAETKDAVSLFDGKDRHTIKVADIAERTQLKQSSMPEGLAGTISPAEFLDLIEFLSSLK